MLSLRYDIYNLHSEDMVGDDMLTTIITVLYLMFVAIICLMTVIYIYKTKKITEKITGAIILILFILRLLLIK